MRFEDLPYRPCVGVLVLNRAGLGFIGQRIEGPEHIDATHAWQMPQGGIDKGEEAWPAALRELREETNIRSVERLGVIADWPIARRTPTLPPPSESRKHVEQPPSSPVTPGP